MKINIVKPVQVDVKIVKIHIKIRDGFECTLVDQDGQTIIDYEGYVPSFMPGEHFGDYLILDIDVDTGKILNWQIPSAKTMESFIANNQ